MNFTQLRTDRKKAILARLHHGPKLPYMIGDLAIPYGR
jgi:hypothetical protein